MSEPRNYTEDPVTPDEYMRFVEDRLAPPPNVVLDLIETADEYMREYTDTNLDPIVYSHDLWHLTVGLQGELIELLDGEPLEEEIGDVVYYATALSARLNTTIPAFDKPSTMAVVSFDIAVFRRVIKDLGNCLKKVLAYGDESKGDLVLAHLKNLWGILESQFNLQLIVNMNHEKLFARYPEGFSLELSRARLDKKNGNESD